MPSVLKKQVKKLERHAQEPAKGQSGRVIGRLLTARCATLPLKTWQVHWDSIRKLNRHKKAQAPDNAPLDAQPEEVPF